MKITILLVTAAVVLLTADRDAFAQHGPRWRGSGGWGPQSAYGKLYDAKSVVTVTGEVVSVQAVSHGKGMSQGIHLTLQTDKETIPVHLGPAWYIENQDIQIEPSDKVVITGSRVTFDNKPAIIAAELKRGGDVLKLRDDTGFPVWAGWRRQ